MKKWLIIFVVLGFFSLTTLSLIKFFKDKPSKYLVDQPTVTEPSTFNPTTTRHRPPPPPPESSRQDRPPFPPPGYNQPPEQADRIASIDVNNLPRFVKHNFIDLSKIGKISKFRSGVGHDFSRGQGENQSCRSMKHYFEPIGINDAFWQRFHHGQLTKSDWPTVKYFAPVTGRIVDVRSATNMFGDKENQFIIESAEMPSVWFEFFHVLPGKDLQKGTTVKAGEFLGTISPGNSGEIAVSINPQVNEQLVSFFQVASDEVFAQYQQRGVKSRDELIISKSLRDSRPLKCSSQPPHRFIGNWLTNDKATYDHWAQGTDNWVTLN